MIKKQQNPYFSDTLHNAWDEGYNCEIKAEKTYYDYWHKLHQLCRKKNKRNNISKFKPDIEEMTQDEYINFLNIKNPYDQELLSKAWIDGRNAYLFDKSLISVSSHYCYTYTNDGKRKLCPFWGAKKIDGEIVGFCSFLETNDLEENASGLLFDQCKECGINTFEDSEEID